MDHRLISSCEALVSFRDTNGWIYLIAFGTSLDTHTVGQKACAPAQAHL